MTATPPPTDFRVGCLVRSTGFLLQWKILGLTWVALVLLTACTHHRPAGAGSRETSPPIRTNLETGTMSEESTDQASPARILYRRSGGFAGVNESLEIRDLDHLTITASGTSFPRRKLTAQERSELDRLLIEMRETTEAEAQQFPAGVSDTFTVELYVDDAESETGRRSTQDAAVALLRRSAVTLPLSGLGKSWDPFLAWLDALLTQELNQHRGGRYELLIPRPNQQD